MEITETQKQFLMTEYVQLRSEIMLCIQGIENTERYAIVFSGAIWAWLATQKWNSAFVVVLFIPALITKLLEMKRGSLADAINQIADYIKKIEDAMGVTNENAGKLGWEHRKKEGKQEDKKENKHRKEDKQEDKKEDEQKHPFRNWRKTYWKVMLWGNIIIGLIYFITSLIVEYKFIHF